jgi:hypothetical protein
VSAPPLAGRVALVVGRSARGLRGIAEGLALRGARVVTAGPLGRETRDGIETREVDTSDPGALAALAEAWLADDRPLHVLVLLEADEVRASALVGRLLPRLLASGRPGAAARVVLADGAWRSRRGRRRSALLAGALHRRVKAADALRRLRAIAAVGRAATLHAACAPETRGGDHVEPGGALGRFGAPARRRLSGRARDVAAGDRLWQAGEAASGVRLDAWLAPALPPEPLRRALRAEPRRISAMLRVRDEEEFLRAAVDSIAPLVDEIVLVDNASTDGTPEIVRALAREHAGKLSAWSYPHPVARVGGEQAEAVRGARGEGVRTLGEYYAWCLARCTQPFVLKWDGDMLALDALAAWLERWRASERPVLAFRGLNVHPDREHLAASRESDRAALERELASPGLPAWATSLTYDSLEPRLFPRLEARYTDAWGWVESLESPFLAARRTWLVADEPLFLHVKLCKRDPWSGYTPDLARVIAGNLALGPPLAPAHAHTLHRWLTERDVRTSTDL